VLTIVIIQGELYAEIIFAFVVGYIAHLYRARVGGMWKNLFRALAFFDLHA